MAAEAGRAARVWESSHLQPKGDLEHLLQLPAGGLGAEEEGVLAEVGLVTATGAAIRRRMERARKEANGEAGRTACQRGRGREEGPAVPRAISTWS